MVRLLAISAHQWFPNTLQSCPTDFWRTSSSRGAKEQPPNVELIAGERDRHSMQSLIITQRIMGPFQPSTVSLLGTYCCVAKWEVNHAVTSSDHSVEIRRHAGDRTKAINDSLRVPVTIPKANPGPGPWWNSIDPELVTRKRMKGQIHQPTNNK